MQKLAGKVALVTGGNSGIGLATAKLFKDEGAQVVITARSPATYEVAQKEYGRMFDVVQADVTEAKDLDRLFDRIKTQYGGLDVLFANAGIAQFRPTVEVDAAFFDAHFNTNVRGLYFTVAKALPLMRAGSSVVLNASVVGSKGFAGSSVYSATKAAVRNFARSWTAEIPVEKVRFNVVSPGPIQTEIFAKMGFSPEQASEFEKSIQASVPAHRFGRPEEIARTVLFLASPDSSFVVGAEIFADGGLGQV